jgi:site-specific recombinase XerD
MSEKRTEKKIYNSEIKEKYLSTLPDNTANVFRFAFYRSFDTEDVVGKDLYNFTTDEIKDALINADHSTFNSIKLTMNVFESYIKWASKEGLVYSNIQIADTITNDELKSYIDKTKKIFFSYEEIREMTDHMANAQDSAILICLFEGIGGSGLSELSNLHYYDIDWIKNSVQLKDDKFGKRAIVVSEECLKLIKSAYYQSEYLSNNGEATGKTPRLDIVQSDYIFKNTKTRNTKTTHGVDKHTFYRRISVASRHYEYKYLTAKNVEKSGMIYHAKELYLKTGKLEKEELALIAEKFGVRKVTMNGYKIYNYSILRQFINSESIKSLYPEVDVSNIPF